MTKNKRPLTHSYGSLPVQQQNLQVSLTACVRQRPSRPTSKAPPWNSSAPRCGCVGRLLFPFDGQRKKGILLRAMQQAPAEFGHCTIQSGIERELPVCEGEQNNGIEGEQTNGIEGEQNRKEREQGRMGERARESVVSACVCLCVSMCVHTQCHWCT